MRASQATEHVEDEPTANKLLYFRLLFLLFLLRLSIDVDNLWLSCGLLNHTLDDDNIVVVVRHVLRRGGHRNKLLLLLLLWWWIVRGCIYERSGLAWR